MKQRGRPRKNREEIRQEQETPEALAPKLSPKQADDPETFNQSELVSFVMRIENMEDEKTIAARTIIDIYAEAKEQGIATAILREAIRLRKLVPHERAAYEALRNQYMQALGVKP